MPKSESSMFVIEKKIQIKASVQEVFYVLTNSREIPRFFPVLAVESNWVEGGEVLYKGELNGHPFTDYGIINRLSSPNVYEYRYWSDNHGTPRMPQNYLTIRYQLAQTDGKTLLTVTQSNIKSEQMFNLMNNQVWGYLLDSLKNYVEEKYCT